MDTHVKSSINGPRREKIGLPGLAYNNRHTHSLISAFVIRLMESIKSNFIFLAVSVAEQAGLNITLWESFVVTWPKYVRSISKPYFNILVKTYLFLTIQ